MSLRVFVDLSVSTRAPFPTAPTKVTHLVTGCLVREEPGRLVVIDDTETVHHVHTHAELIIRRA